MKQIDIVLCTHIHSDHFNIRTLKRLQFERPSLRIGCGNWMVERLNGLKNIDVYDPGIVYNYGTFSISPVTLFHDVENFGYRIYKEQTKVFHATDTAHLKGIEAIGYDLYALEHSYNEDTIYESIESLKLQGKFAYQEGAINSHLSEQKAREFIYNNKKEDSKVLRLHESKSS